MTGSLPPTHSTDIIYTLLAHMRGGSIVEIVSQQTAQFYWMLNGISKTQVDPGLIILGTIPLSLLITHTLLKASSLYEIAWLWDWAAPTGSVLGLVPMLIITAEQLIRPVFWTGPKERLALLLNPLSILVLLAGLSAALTIAVEIHSSIERPDDVDPIADRAPEWLLNGLDFEEEDLDR